MAKQSLVTRIESNPGAGLPAGFMHSETNLVTKGPVFGLSPYVIFASTRSENFARWSAEVPGLNDGDPLLVRGEKLVRLLPFQFHLIRAFQHFSIVDNTGTILRMTRDPNVAKAESTKSARFDEHIETVLLVVLPDEIVPARCTFKTTKTNAAHKAIQAVTLAATPEWAKLSPDHKETLNAPQPWMRVLVNVTLKAGTSRSSGFRYVAANASIKPTGVADWRRIGKFFEDEQGTASANEVVAQYERRLEDVMAKEA